MISVPYVIRQDTIEVMEYHDGRTSKGRITQLTQDSLKIQWDTGDENDYVRHLDR